MKMIPHFNEVLMGFINEFLNTPGFAIRLGAMISTAIVLGFALYDDYSKFWKWLFTGMVYIGFLEWLRSSFLAHIGQPYTGRSAVLGLISSTIFGLSILAGAILAKKMKSSSYIKNIESEEKFIMDILSSFDTKGLEK
jgi:hypothetical protein